MRESDWSSDVCSSDLKVVSSDFLPKFADALREQYAGAVDKASQSTAADVERMKTAFWDLKVSIGDTFGESTHALIRGTTNTLKELAEQVKLTKDRFDSMYSSAETVFKVFQMVNRFSMSSPFNFKSGATLLTQEQADASISRIKKTYEEKRRLANIDASMMADLYRQEMNEIAKVNNMTMRSPVASSVAVSTSSAVSSSTAKSTGGKPSASAATAERKAYNDMNRAISESYKARYDDQLYMADEWLMKQRDAGANELDSYLVYINKRNDALYEWYGKEWDLIESSAKTFEEKEKEKEKFTKQYTRQVNDNSRAAYEARREYADRSSDVELGLQKTINGYSDDYLNSAIRALEKRYKEAGRYTKNEALLYRALEEEKKRLIDGQLESRLSYYEQTGVYAKDATEIIKKLADEEYEKVLKVTKSEIVARKAQTDFTKDHFKDMAESGDDFFEGMKAGWEDYWNHVEKRGKKGSDLMKDLISAESAVYQSSVDAFIRGEDVKVAAKSAAVNAISGLATKYSSIAFEEAAKVINDSLIPIIGAYIGEGAAAVGGKGAQEGGIYEALGQIALYLGTGVASILGGKALAQQFYAGGGWLSRNPNGGKINEGSGNADDVFLGTTPGVRHWGMGGEFVVNKDATQKNLALLQMINAGHDSGGPVGDPGALAYTMRTGGEASFWEAYGDAGGGYQGIVAGIVADIWYISDAIGSAFTGKALASKFHAGGGYIDKGYGIGDLLGGGLAEIGRASCRERVCQYV
jgi:hypothetical protein